MTRFLLMLLALSISISAHAATVLKLDFDQLVKESDAALIATVVRIEPFQDGSRIFSRIYFDVEETWKGDTIKSFEIVQPGGRLGSIVTRVPGMPEFEVGDRQILFLESSRDGQWVVLGLEQGRFLLEGDRVLSKASVHLHLVTRDGKHADQIEFPADLKSFKSSVLEPKK